MNQHLIKLSSRIFANQKATSKSSRTLSHLINRKFNSGHHVRQFSSTSMNRNENIARQALYSYEIYALPTERDYDRIIPDSIEDKQAIIDLNMDIRNVLNYVVFLACDKYSSKLLKGYQEHKFSYGKDRLVSILKLVNDQSANSGTKPSLEKVLDKSTTDYFDIIDGVNSFAKYLNRELNRLDSNFSEDNKDSSISENELNNSLEQCGKDIEKLNTVFSKMYTMANVDPLDDDLIDNELYHPIALYLKNKMRIVSVKMNLQKDDQKLNNIDSLKFDHDRDEILSICDKIQERALLYMSTLQFTKAFSDITLCTQITQLLVTKNDDKKDILITRELISLQNLIYMYCLLKEYVVIINKRVDFDFTTENPKDLHHFFVETFKIVQQSRFKNEIIQLNTQMSVPDSMVVLRNVSLQFALMASNQLSMLKTNLDGKRFDFLDKYHKDLETTMKALKLKSGLVILRKVISFVLWAMASIWLFRYISRLLEGEPLFK